MTHYLVPDWLNVLLKSYTTRLAAIGLLAELVLDYGLSIDLPWYVNAGLLGLIFVARLVKQQAVSGSDSDDEPLGI